MSSGEVAAFRRLLPEGRTWLETAEGTEWLRTDEGGAWLESPDAREWFEELAQRGYERYFSGEIEDAPDWAITPSTAPQIGSRVRLTKTETTMGGQRFREGELMIVDELRFSPAGIVWVGLRAIDGRHRMTGMLGEFVPANSRTR